MEGEAGEERQESEEQTRASLTSTTTDIMDLTFKTLAGLCDGQNNSMQVHYAVACMYTMQ